MQFASHNRCAHSHNRWLFVKSVINTNQPCPIDCNLSRQVRQENEAHAHQSPNSFEASLIQKVIIESQKKKKVMMGTFRNNAVKGAFPVLRRLKSSVTISATVDCRLWTHAGEDPALVVIHDKRCSLHLIDFTDISIYFLLCYFFQLDAKSWHFLFWSESIPGITLWFDVLQIQRFRYHTVMFFSFLYGFKIRYHTLMLYDSNDVSTWSTLSEAEGLRTDGVHSQRHPKLRNWSSLHWTAILQFILWGPFFSRQPKVIKRTGMTQLTQKC